MVLIGRAIIMSHRVEPTGPVLVDVAAGDLVEVSNGEERLRGRLLEYTGELFVGKSGRSLRYYRDHDFEFALIEKAANRKLPVDVQTIRQVVRFLHVNQLPIAADLVDLSFAR